MRRSASSGSSSRPVKRTPRWSEGDSQALGPNPRQRSCLEPKSQPPRSQYIDQSCLDHLLSLLTCSLRKRPPYVNSKTAAEKCYGEKMAGKLFHRNTSLLQFLN